MKVFQTRDVTAGAGQSQEEDAPFPLSSSRSPRKTLRIITSCQNWAQAVAERLGGVRAMRPEVAVGTGEVVRSVQGVRIREDVAYKWEGLLNGGQLRLTCKADI